MASTDQQKYNILYVDDEEPNLRIFKYAFGRDFNVFIASSGEEALKIMESNDVHLIVSDQRMPKMTGVELLKIIVPKNPGIVRMILSGYSDLNVLIEAVNEIGINKYLQKPWNREDLKSIFDKELEQAYGD